MTEIIQAFLLIFMAEMGDKTQILAMAFATKYPVKKVLLGIGIGAFLNHGIAVALGSLIGARFDLQLIQLIAGIAFIGFALWSLKEEDDEDETEAKQKWGAVFTVAMAFFIGELGDKTQLTAITLATTAKMPLAILCGTVLGMLATGGLGIIVGRKLGDKIPEMAIKILSASVFFVFGSLKLYQNLPSQFTTPVILIVYGLLFLSMSWWLLKPQLVKQRAGQKTPYQKTAKALHDYYYHLKNDFDILCQGEGACGECKQGDCVIGRGKMIVSAILTDEAFEKAHHANLIVPSITKEEVSVHLEEMKDFLDKHHQMSDNDKENLEILESYLEHLNHNAK